MLTIRQAIINFTSKGPVRRETSQRDASQAYNIIETYLTPAEKTAICIARSHALFCNEGRGEFDRIMKPVKERLLKYCDFLNED